VRIGGGRSPESQDVCFLSGGDYRGLLSRELPQSIRPGRSWTRRVDCWGSTTGCPFTPSGSARDWAFRHSGLSTSCAWTWKPTLSSWATGTWPGQRAFLVEDVSCVSGEAPPNDADVQVRVRHRAALVPARVEALPTAIARVELDAPRRDIAPGQAAVFYGGQQVLGGGIIREVLPDRAVD